VVTLRATKKVLRWLSPASAPDVNPDTALGDWYVNRFVVDRQPLLLLVSSRSLLPIIEPARKIRQLPDRLPDMIRQRLQRLGVAHALIEREIAAMHSVLVGPTRDRSVLGTLLDFGRTVPYCLPENGWSEVDLRLAESRLAETPCRVTTPGRSSLFPCDTAPQLLEEAWGRIHCAFQ
jgi:hypothetical protein